MKKTGKKICIGCIQNALFCATKALFAHLHFPDEPNYENDSSFVCVLFAIGIYLPFLILFAKCTVHTVHRQTTDGRFIVDHYKDINAQNVVMCSSFPVCVCMANPLGTTDAASFTQLMDSICICVEPIGKLLMIEIYEYKFKFLP